MSLEFLMFFYILAAVMIFQGMHLFGEVAQPLGTVPEEVAQNPATSQRWGSFLMAYGGLMVLCGILSHTTAYFETALLPLRNIALIALIAYGAWVVFKGRTIEFIGQPTLDDHDHGQAHH